MKMDVIGMLSCSRCLSVNLGVEFVSDGNEEEIINGLVACKDCGLSFNVVDGIINMLPPELRTKGEAAYSKGHADTVGK